VRHRLGSQVVIDLAHDVEVVILAQASMARVLDSLPTWDVPA